MSEWLRRRLLWSAVLVLISLGGAGLATAVDRPYTQAERPEVGWRADQRAEPWLSGMLLELEAVEAAVADLSDAGRQVLVLLSLIELDEIETRLDAGDAALVRLNDRLSTLEQLRADEPAGAEPWRLGEARRELVARLDAAIEACAGLEQSWRELGEAAQLAQVLLAVLTEHDELALEALAAGREADWADAVELLGQALPLLDDAEAALPVLQPDDPPPASLELISGLRAQDQALIELYGYLAEDGSLEDPEADSLRAAVEDARVPLPTPEGALQRLLAAGPIPTVGGRLAQIEQARGLVADALQPADEEPPADGAVAADQ